MPRGGRKMKGGAEGNPVTINGQSYTISSEDKEGKTVICVSVDKPKATEEPAEGEEETDAVVVVKPTDAEGERETDAEVVVNKSPGGKRRRGGKTAKKGGKSAKKGGKTGGTRKRGGRKGGKK